MMFTNKTYLVSAKVKVSGVFKPLRVQVQAEDVAEAETAAYKRLPENSIIVHTERMLGKNAQDRRAGLHRALDCVLDRRAAKDANYISLRNSQPKDLRRRAFELVDKADGLAEGSATDQKIALKLLNEARVLFSQAGDQENARRCHQDMAEITRLSR